MRDAQPSNTRPTSPTASPTRRRVRLADAATYAGVSAITLRRMIKDGRLPAHRFGSKIVMVDLDDIDAAATRIPAGNAS